MIPGIGYNLLSALPNPADPPVLIVTIQILVEYEAIVMPPVLPANQADTISAFRAKIPM